MFRVEHYPFLVGRTGKPERSMAEVILGVENLITEPAGKIFSIKTLMIISYVL
jgi:hypothetical protein